MAETAPLAPGTGSESDPGGRGRLTVHDRVVERIAAHVASEVPGVAPYRGRLRRLTGQRLPRASAEISGRVTAVDVSVAVAWGTPMDDVAGAVRNAVRERLEVLGGMQVTRLNVTVKHIVRQATQERVQ